MPQNTLFIHGNLASNRWWQPAFEIWRSQKSPTKTGTAFLAEWRGCGESSRGLAESDFEMSKIAQQYIEFLEDLAIGPVDVVGHSTGGLIALLAVLERPELFRKIVLLDAVAPKAFELDPQLLGAFEVMRKDREQCEAVMAMTIHEVSRASSFFQKIVDDAFSVDPNLWTGVPKALERVDCHDKLRQIVQPTLILHGELDPVLPKADSEWMAKEIPNSKYVEIKGHGHSLNVEDPVQFVNLVDPFLM